jgi:hypothetical protein
MNKMKTRKLGVVLFALLLAAMAMVPIVSAQYNMNDINSVDHLTINLENKNVTNVIAYDVTSKANLSSYNIPKPEDLWIPGAVNKFDAVTFDHVSLNDQLKSGKGIVISIGGKDYQAELSRMKFENNTDGVYSYYGTLLGVNNSSILFTTRKNVIFGRITSENDTFWIIPVEPRVRTEISQSPLHIIYSSKDVTNVEFTIDQQPVTKNGVNSPAISQNGVSNLQLTPPDQQVYVDILVVTDSEFFNTPDWLGSASNIINNANLVLERDNINVHLIGHYDASRRNLFSGNTTKTSDPLALFTYLYTPADLDSFSSDIGIYLGGNNRDGGAQGESYGYTAYDPYCRYAWAQMVYDDPFYIGTPHGQAIVSLHEIGHMFDAHHDDAIRPPEKPQYTRAFYYSDSNFPFDHKTVMWHDYSESVSTFEFSSYSSSHCGGSVICHGDITHDNARRIQETRDIVDYYSHRDKIGVYQNGVWYRDFNGTGISPGVTTTFGGGTGYVPILGDWTLEGTTKIGVTNGQSWFLDWNGNGVWDNGIDHVYNFGAPGWTPVVGDWNHDGHSKIGVTNGALWYLDWNGNGAWDGADKTYSFGATGWTPVVGDWNCDGTTEIGVTNGATWYLDWNNNGAWNPGIDKEYIFGNVGWTPVVGHWTESSQLSPIVQTKIGVYKDGMWYLDYTGDGAWNTGDAVYSFGAPGWTPVVGEWNCYETPKIGITNGAQWYLDVDGDGVFTSIDKYFNFGVSGWTPVIGRWS